MHIFIPLLIFSLSTYAMEESEERPDTFCLIVSTDRTCNIEEGFYMKMKSFLSVEDKIEESLYDCLYRRINIEGERAAICKGLCDLDVLLQQTINTLETTNISSVDQLTEILEKVPYDQENFFLHTIWLTICTPIIKNYLNQDNDLLLTQKPTKESCITAVLMQLKKKKEEIQKGHMCKKLK